MQNEFVAMKTGCGNESGPPVARSNRKTHYPDMYVIATLALTGFIVVMARRVGPICNEFEVPVTFVSRLAFGLYLSAVFASLGLATVVLRVFSSFYFHKWKHIACWTATGIATIAIIGSVLGILAVFDSLQ